MTLVIRADNIGSYQINLQLLWDHTNMLTIQPEVKYRLREQVRQLFCCPIAVCMVTIPLESMESGSQKDFIPYF